MRHPRFSRLTDFAGRECASRGICGSARRLGWVPLKYGKGEAPFRRHFAFAVSLAVEIERRPNQSNGVQSANSRRRAKTLEGHPRKGTLAEIPFRVTLIAPLRLVYVIALTVPKLCRRKQSS